MLEEIGLPSGREIEDKRRLERYRAETQRLLGVREDRLQARDWIIGRECTVADISLLGCVRNLVGFHGACELVDFDSRYHVPAWL